MADALAVLVVVIIGSYALRWGFMYIVKRQRIDMKSEPKRIQKDVIRGFRVNKRMTRWLWKMSGWRPK